VSYLVFNAESSAMSFPNHCSFLSEHVKLEAVAQLGTSYVSALDPDIFSTCHLHHSNSAVHNIVLICCVNQFRFLFARKSMKYAMLMSGVQKPVRVFPIIFEPSQR
jgi:hypothetical protein